MVTLKDIQTARDRLQGVSVRTPLLASRIHEQNGGPSDRCLYLKPENLQPIGAFKLRGAYNKIASLSPEERQRGVITYSSGNHAQGVAYSARALGVRALVVMPANAPAMKRAATASLGAEIVLVGPGSDERKGKAEELAEKHGLIVVPPYDDETIIAGQGTMALEIVDDLPELETILVPVGGGGLISGIATAVKLSKPSAQVIGVEPELACDAQASLRSGAIVELPADAVSRTAADGLRAQSIGKINFEHMRRYVDDIITVSEEEIVEAMRRLATNPKTVAEPSGAVAVAGFLFHEHRLPKTRVNVAVISGGNIAPQALARIHKLS